MKPKIEVRLDILETVKKDFFSAKFVREVGDTVLDGIKDAAAKGLSPVAGVGRFPGYKAQEEAKAQKRIARNAWQNASQAGSSSTGVRLRNLSRSASDEAKKSAQGYPVSVQDKFPQKKIRPVNLSLTGEYLNSLRYSFNRSKLSIRFFFAGKRANLLAETHNEGTQEPVVARRPVLPTADGQEFISSIMRAINTLYRNRLASIIEMSKKKR